MNVRLQYAYTLLSPNSVIFISIDDHELSSVKILCEEIFDASNYIGILPRVTKKSGKDHADDITKNHDYVLVLLFK